MPDFKPGDVVRLKRPENWPYIGGNHGYLWVVYAAPSNAPGVAARSVATGIRYAFSPADIEGADNE
jgi:hypothetical protein